MTLFILYFIKVNVALAVLYLFYKLLFSKDTFFGFTQADADIDLHHRIHLSIAQFFQLDNNG